MKYLAYVAVLIAGFSAGAATLALAPPLAGPPQGDREPGQNCPGNGDPQMRDEGRPRPPRPGDKQGPGSRRPPRPGDQPQEPAVDLSKLSKGTVVIQGGHATDPRDGGRPVVLVAAGLGVEPQVFRDAFSGVRPARGRGPTDAEAQRNKQVLMTALGKYGVTNDRLDEVSNYYRYRPESGQLWKHQPAQATATIENGQVTGLTITSGGAGYSSPPQVVIAGYPDVKIKADVEFGTDLRTNGKVTSLTVIK
ncbi:hypothetical protein [Blastopirellula marina]|uniref:Uncharacterized protein n=1 Tax=Blastopirellula marina TaxID=124 RepID=A0A2S8GL53_9BACT|nr:hypothetical protein [Blastopirellula marina]PQO45166.1 hypothetical protein C5Y93_16675 [Blastopirellula marina]